MSKLAGTMKPEPKRRTITELPKDDAFAEVVKLMALGSDAASRLEEIQAEANGRLLELIDEYRAEYAQCQSALTQTEAALEVHCRAHKQQWFSAAKSIKTPYGKVAFREGSSLVVKEPEATVRLMRALEPRLNQTLGAEKAPWIAEEFIRVVEMPDLEALEKLSDEVLGLFMVKRQVSDSFSFTPAKVDFGKSLTEKSAENPGNN
jgi:hypothetical protein